MRFLVRVLATVVINLICFGAKAQTGVLKGNIITSDGKPAEQVNITLKELKATTASAISLFAEKSATCSMRLVIMYMMTTV